MKNPSKNITRGCVPAKIMKNPIMKNLLKIIRKPPCAILFITIVTVDPLLHRLQPLQQQFLHRHGRLAVGLVLRPGTVARRRVLGRHGALHEARVQFVASSGGIGRDPQAVGGFWMVFV